MSSLKGDGDAWNRFLKWNRMPEMRTCKKLRWTEFLFLVGISYLTRIKTVKLSTMEMNTHNRWSVHMTVSPYLKKRKNCIFWNIWFLSVYNLQLNISSQCMPFLKKHSKIVSWTRVSNSRKSLTNSFPMHLSLPPENIRKP